MPPCDLLCKLFSYTTENNFQYSLFIEEKKSTLFVKIFFFLNKSKKKKESLKDNKTDKPIYTWQHHKNP